MDLTDQPCEPLPVEDPSAVQITGLVPWAKGGCRCTVDDVAAEPDVA